VGDSLFGLKSVNFTLKKTPIVRKYLLVSARKKNNEIGGKRNKQKFPLENPSFCILVKDLKILGSGFSSTICKLKYSHKLILLLIKALIPIFI
jgi:hypothetical protein